MPEEKGLNDIVDLKHRWSVKGRKEASWWRCICIFALRERYEEVWLTSAKGTEYRGYGEAEESGRYVWGKRLCDCYTCQ